MRHHVKVSRGVENLVDRDTDVRPGGIGSLIKWLYFLETNEYLDPEMIMLLGDMYGHVEGEGIKIVAWKIF